jgi:hypothetical protein
LPIGLSYSHAVLGLLRGFVKAAEIFRAGWWAAHLLETFIHAPPHPIPASSSAQ